MCADTGADDCNRCSHDTHVRAAHCACLRVVAQQRAHRFSTPWPSWRACATPWPRSVLCRVRVCARGSRRRARRPQTTFDIARLRLEERTYQVTQGTQLGASCVCARPCWRPQLSGACRRGPTRECGLALAARAPHDGQPAETAGPPAGTRARCCQCVLWPRCLPRSRAGRHARRADAGAGFCGVGGGRPVDSEVRGNR